MTLLVPPHSIEAEQSVLGAVLLDSSIWFRLSDVVSEADFYRGDHRLIWRAICTLVEGGDPADVLTVGRALERDPGRVDIAYLAELVEGVSGTANAKAYAEIVRDRAQLRAVLTASHRIADAAMNPEGRKAPEVIGEAQSAVLALSQESTDTAVEMPAALRDLVDDLDARRSGSTTGIRVGRRDFDHRHQGFEGQELIILAARPAMGKTTVAMDWASHVARESGRVLVFSLEMSSRALMRRLVSQHARIPAPVLRSGDLSEDDWPRLTAAMSQVKGLPLTIDDAGGLHINQIRARARAAHMRSPLSLLVVDYLQLVRGDGRSLLETTTQVSQGLKALAKELRISVVALSQLSRKCEERQDKRPLMSDLRESGSIEQDADRVVMLYRPEVYDEHSPRRGVLELITRKFREGEVGTDYALTDLAHSTITDTPEGWTLPPETAQKPRRYDGSDL